VSLNFKQGSKKPHVLYVTPMFGYPAFGGPRLRTYTTIKALARCADVSLYLTQQPDAQDREQTRAHLLTFCRDVYFPDAPVVPGGLRALVRALVPGPLRSLIRRARRPAQAVQDFGDKSAERDPAVVAALRAWIDTYQPDLLWLGFGGISYDLIPLKQHTGKPLVLETECVWSRFILRELPFETDAVRRQRIVYAGQAKEAEERQGAQEVDITTAVSDVDGDYFKSLVPDPERVMRLNNVIDVDSYVEPVPASVDVQRPALVFAGTFSVGTANVDATIWLVDEVLPIVWARRPEVRLYVVGRNPAPSILDRRGPRVHVTGEVASIAPYMRASVAALVPLRWESGTRFKILEAFACRTPVVSTTLGAEGLDVEHDRHLLLADDAQSFAAAILALIEQPALGQRLIGPAYELVRREYDLSSAERQINAVLERLGLRSGVGVP
jgi:polysaccharide biosynthesis protein PslH